MEAIRVPKKGLIEMKLREFEKIIPELDDFEKLGLIDIIRQYLPPNFWQKYIRGEI